MAPIGTTIAVDAGGRIVGNIGTGCHESEIVEAAAQTARDGRTRLLDINLTIEDEIFAAPGCGAIMQVVTWLPEPPLRKKRAQSPPASGPPYVTFDYADAAGSRQIFRNEYPPKESLISSAQRHLRPSLPPSRPARTST